MYATKESRRTGLKYDALKELVATLARNCFIFLGDLSTWKKIIYQFRELCCIIASFNAKSILCKLRYRHHTLPIKIKYNI